MLWVGTFNSGLNKVIVNPNTDENENDTNDVTFIHYKKEPGNFNTLSDNTILSIYAAPDEPDILWICSNGINKFYKTSKKFIHYFPGKKINSFDEDNNGRLWIGTEDGLICMFRDIKGKVQFKNYFEFGFNSRSNLGEIFLVTVPSNEPNVLWVGSMKGIDKIFIDQNDLSVSNVINFNSKLSITDGARSIRCIIESSLDPNVLWIGTQWDGLIRFDSENGSVKNYLKNLEDPIIWSILESVEDPNILWVGTMSGLVKFNKKDETFSVYNEDADNPFSITNEIIFGLYQSMNNPGVLWIGTYGGGLNKLDIKSGKFNHYTQQEGLPGNIVFQIIGDDDDNLWLNAQELSYFNIKTESFRNYNMNDGLPETGFQNGAFYKNKSEEIFSGGNNGFKAFFPDSLKDNKRLPQIAITGFNLFNQPVRIKNGSLSEESKDKLDFLFDKSITETKEIVLSYKHNFFSFEFAALDYAVPIKNQYAYKMEGFDKDWIYTGNKRSATYTNLDPGEYVFCVKGSNNDGVWNEAGASLKIIITPPFWKTWWAYATYIIVFILLLLAARRYEMNRMRLKNQLEIEQVEAEKLKELDQVKSKFFANISHEFRTPLTLILGPAEDIISEHTDRKIVEKAGLIKRNANRLLRLINQLLDLSKLESGTIELKANSNNIIPYIKGILFSFESLAKQKQIILHFHSDYENVEVYFDSIKMEQVFYNLISNAIKFTPAGGEVNVSVSQQTSATYDSAVISVKDTGIGIPSDQLTNVFNRFYQIKSSYHRELEGAGIGLALAKEIVELHDGQIRVVSDDGNGTEFIVSLLLGKEHLRESNIIEKQSAVIYPSKVTDYDDIVESTNQDETDKSVQDEESKIILIVEDNMEVRNFISQRLSASYKILEAEDGVEGFEKAALFIPDLIISDVMMPNMDGNELCRNLKNDERTSHIPVIILTAKGGEESKLEGLETGADDYLTKPFSSRELLVRVRSLIEIRKKLREKFSREQFVSPGKIVLPSVDKKFLDKLKEVIEQNIGDENFTVEDLAGKTALSRMQLHRKLKAITNQSASEFILNIRLQRAAEMIKQNSASISEIAYSTGFIHLTILPNVSGKSLSVLLQSIRRRKTIISYFNKTRK